MNGLLVRIVPQASRDRARAPFPGLMVARIGWIDANPKTVDGRILAMYCTVTVDNRIRRTPTRLNGPANVRHFRSKKMWRIPAICDSTHWHAPNIQTQSPQEARGILVIARE
jgi:hypothetical protein